MSTQTATASAASKTPKPLAFGKAEKARIKTILARYPREQKQSAVIPVLMLAQKTFGGWLSREAMDLVAQTLEMPYIRVYEVATFYTMFNLQPVGKYHVQVCTNCACMIRGSGKIMEAVQEESGAVKGKTSKDALFTLTEVECLGACVDAPMMQINEHYYTNLTPEGARHVIRDLREGRTPKPDTPAKPLEDY